MVIIDFLPTEKDFKYEYQKQEIWSPITNFDIENIVPNRYVLSTWGRVYDNFKNTVYPNELTIRNCPTYFSKYFKNIDGTYTRIFIYVLMCRKFIHLHNINSTDIDHIDGNKFHNWVWNLEPVTHQENLIRAVKLGLYPTGENQQNAIFKNSEIEKVCEFLS